MPRSLALAAVLPAVLFAQDPREIVRRSIEIDQKNFEISRNYTFLERRQEDQLDEHGRVTHTESRTWDVTLLEGSPYRRLVARDDKPLPPRDEQREQEKLAKSNEERRKETPEQKARRIAESDKNQQKRREPVREIPDAFDFRFTGEATIDGVDCWTIDATPKPGYKPKLSSASFLPKVKLRFWIEKRGDRWARAEMETLDTISLGGVVFRLARGSRLVLEQTRVNNEVWLPKLIDLTIEGRIMLVRGIRRHIRTNISNYKKFQAESRVVE